MGGLVTGENAEMSDELKQLAITFFQNSLSKFCAGDKNRPTGYEIEMFKAGYGYAEEKIEALESKLAKAREALEFYANDSWDLGCGCCQIIDSEVFRVRDEIALQALKEIGDV